MIASLFVLAALAASSASAGGLDYSADALKDQITDLPGAPPGSSGFKMFSGYIDVSRPSEPSITRKMFYWYTESQNDPATDPLVLWTNGGPGCSGLSGFMNEQGPFRPTKEGGLEMNDFAWNKAANMVFIEQPVGVGFSTVDGGTINYGDEPSAQDNYKFVTGFLEKFGAFNKTDFYISSESYGGHYMPTLARELVTQGGVPTFRGVFLGNPLTWMPYRNYGQYGTAYGHQLLPKPLWDQYTASGCRTSFPPSDRCNTITGAMDKILAGFDAYALDFPVCLDPALAAGRDERFVMAKMIHKANHGAAARDGAYFPADYAPCSSDYATTYLNRADVQAAIHAVKPSKGWASCSDAVGSVFNATDVNQPMMPVWKEVVAKAPALKIMIYSGDDDSVCATLGTQQFIWDLGLKAAPGSKSWDPWLTEEGQTAGFLTKFQPNFSFATVHGAGHMVPSTRPAQSLTLFHRFLAGEL